MKGAKNLDRDLAEFTFDIINKCNEQASTTVKIVPIKSRDDGVERIATILAAQDWVWI